MPSKEKIFPLVFFNLIVLEQKDVDSINKLRKELSKSAEKRPDVDKDTLTAILSQSNFLFIIFRYYDSNEIIGMASIYYAKTTINPEGIGRVEDVVIDKRYHGHGLGDLMIDRLKYLAKSRGLSKLELTSNPDNPDRLSAIQLYLKHGFKKRETSCYELDLKEL